MPLPKVLLASLILTLLLGFGLPPATLAHYKPFPTDLSRSIRSEASAALVFDEAAFRDRVAQPGAGCERVACGVRKAQVVAEGHASSEPGAKKNQARVHSHLQFKADDQVFLSTSEEVTLQRDSTYPIADPTAISSVELFGQRAEFGPEARQSMHHGFPFITLPRTYSYFDPIIHDHYPLDFVDRRDLPRADGSLRVFEFHQHIPPHAVPTQGLELAGVAADFFDEEELAARQLDPGAQRSLKPFYQVDRTLFVEPKTGRIVDRQEHIEMIWALDYVEAQMSIDAGEAEKRAIFIGDMNWDKDTVAAQEAEVTKVIKNLHLMRIISWVAKMAALVIAGVLLYSWWRRRA